MGVSKMYDHLVFKSTPCSLLELYEAFDRAKEGEVVSRQSLTTGGWALLRKNDPFKADWFFPAMSHLRPHPFTLLGSMAFKGGKTYLVETSSFFDESLLWE